MDTIHHLLRLNVEIEGALLVLANRDNEIAMRILDEKTKELSEIVGYLVHPEENNLKSSEEKAVDGTTDAKDFYIGNSLAPSEAPSVFSDDENSEIFKIINITEQSHSGDNDSYCTSNNVNNAESCSVDRMLNEETCNISEQRTKANDKKIGSTCGKNKISDSLATAEHQEKEQTIGTEPDSLSSEIQKVEITRVSDSQKDKIRIDEMLTRKEARDLSKAFTINDRFRFQTHIFDGDREAFNNTLRVLSSLNDYDSALTYLSGILETDTEDQDTMDFLAIVQNHFGVR